MTGINLSMSPPRSMSSSATPIVVDTDVGTDVDDAFALLLALASPELDLVGVSVTDGDVELRSRIAARLLGMAGKSDVPVFKGLAEPIGLGRGPTMLGHEGQGILDVRYDGPEATVREIPAAEWLIEEPRRRRFHLVGIGPYQTIATAFVEDPALSERLLGLTVMGGVFDEADSLRVTGVCLSRPGYLRHG